MNLFIDYINIGCTLYGYELYQAITLYVFQYLYLQHSMRVYLNKIIRGYLEKGEKYTIPTSRQMSLPCGKVVPSISNLFLHVQGSDMFLIVEGSNLWFCYQLRSGKHLSIIPNETNGTFMKFIISNNKVKFFVDITDGQIFHGHLDSYFFEPLPVHTVVHKKVRTCMLFVRAMHKMGNINKA